MSLERWSWSRACSGPVYRSQRSSSGLDLAPLMLYASRLDDRQPISAMQAKEPQTARYRFGSGLFHLTHGAVEFVRPVIGSPKNVYGEFDPGSELTLAA